MKPRPLPTALALLLPLASCAPDEGLIQLDDPALIGGTAVARRSRERC
jgi:hypothetical protein